MQSEEPSLKERKYDRQIRLWGAGGQRALETARVCLLNASGAGSEALKNLVLPGIGSFVVVDGNVVTELDLGTNFFVTADDLNQPRGPCVTKWLLELNPDVKGTSLQEDPAVLVAKQPAYFHDHHITLVIATQLTDAVTLQLARVLDDAGVPLLVVRPYGLMGFLRVKSPDYPILETFPDQQVEDYHILNPFPELDAFVSEVGDPDFIEDTMLHSHIPWICLLVHFIRKWKQQTGWTGTALTYAQKKEVLAMVAASKRKQDEENFEEARLAGAKINPPEVPRRLLDLMGAAEAALAGGPPEPFWFCMSALQRFYVKHQRLPVTGHVADMTSTTQWFLRMQGVYAAKAQQDIEEMAALVGDAVGRLAGRGPPTLEVPREYVALFCRNVWHVQYLRYRPLRLEYDPATAMSATLNRGLEADDPHITSYLLLRASDRFHAAHQRFPGQTDAADDEAALAATLKALCAELGVTQAVSAERVRQWVGFGAGELHTVGALLGGLAAQEAIKLLTHQRVPVNNTLVVSGVAGTMAALEL